MLDHYGLLPGPDDLKAAIESLFPELGSALRTDTDERPMP